jgi:uncharacterized protein YfiM (DUF2279 family)
LTPQFERAASDLFKYYLALKHYSFQNRTWRVPCAAYHAAASCLLAAAGFAVESIEPHAYVQTTNPDYLLTLLSRGMSAAGRADEIGQAMVESFNSEARRRVANRTFFGSLTFLSVIARKGSGLPKSED